MNESMIIGAAIGAIVSVSVMCWVFYHKTKEMSAQMKDMVLSDDVTADKMEEALLKSYPLLPKDMIDFRTLEPTKKILDITIEIKDSKFSTVYREYSELDPEGNRDFIGYRSFGWLDGIRHVMSDHHIENRYLILLNGKEVKLSNCIDNLIEAFSKG